MMALRAAQVGSVSGRAAYPFCLARPYRPFHSALCYSSIKPSQRLTSQLRAASGDVKEVYKGVYGNWSVEQEDIVEVWSYRVGLSVTAAAVVAASAAALLPDGDGGGVRGTLLSILDPVCFAGAAAFGLSLALIHIYVTILKRALQVFWAMGTAGAVYLAVTQDVSVAEYVAQHREAVWLVGPLFAALTGVAFKEGLCYGKAEAAVLFFLTPTLLGGHLLGILPDSLERSLLGALALTMTVFAARKYTQPVKDDIGDKSVFMNEWQAPSGDFAVSSVACAAYLLYSVSDKERGGLMVSQVVRAYRQMLRQLGQERKAVDV